MILPMCIIFSWQFSTLGKACVVAHFHHMHVAIDQTRIHHSYFEPHPSEQPIPVVISVLRLAHKYDVVFLKRRAIAHLNAILPTKWDDTWRLVNSEEFYEQPERRLDVLPLLDLGAVFETPWLLPALHFTLAPVRINYIFERTAWKSLDRSTQEKFIITRESFFSRQGSSLGRVWTFAPSCLSEQLCMSGLCQIREFGLWKLYLKRDVPILCCEKCTKSFLNECFTSGKTFWENLPQIVCLGSWKNLNDAKDLYAV